MREFIELFEKDELGEGLGNWFRDRFLGPKPDEVQPDRGEEWAGPSKELDPDAPNFDALPQGTPRPLPRPLYPTEGGEPSWMWDDEDGFPDLPPRR